jgi:outer membrane protein
MKKIYFQQTILATFISCFAINAQSVMTADEALKLGLQKNFDIVVAKNEAEADSIFNTRGEAGMLPSVSINGNIGTTNSSIHQRYASGTDITSPNAGSTSYGASIVLNWTLFDGTKMFVTKQKLAAIQQQGEYEYRTHVLNTSALILNSYYNAVLQKQKLNGINEVIKANEERFKITDSRFTAGSGPKTDLNLAKIDLNTQRQNQIVQQELLNAAKRALNLFFARDVNTPLDVVDSLTAGPLPDRAQLEQKMYDSNPQLLAFKSQVQIADLSIRENKSQRYPRVNAYAGYGYAHNENSAGFSLLNESYGWQTGLTIAIPLYQGGSVSRRIDVAMLEQENAQFRFEQAKQQSAFELHNTLATYDSRLAMIALEKENVLLARENMNLALERLRLGQTNGFEVQQAQIALSASLMHVADLQYELKTADINLHRLAADL